VRLAVAIGSRDFCSPETVLRRSSSAFLSGGDNGGGGRVECGSWVVGPAGVA